MSVEAVCQSFRLVYQSFRNPLLTSDAERSRYRNSGRAERQRVSCIVVPNFVHSGGCRLLDLIPDIVLLRANIVQKSLSRRF